MSAWSKKSTPRSKALCITYDASCFDKLLKRIQPKAMLETFNELLPSCIFFTKNHPFFMTVKMYSLALFHTYLFVDCKQHVALFHLSHTLSHECVQHYHFF